MKMLSIFLFFTFMLALPFLHADEKIVSTVNNVDLIAVSKVDKDGHHGTDYFVLNNSTNPVKVSIKLKNSINTLNNLKPEPLVLAPSKRDLLGSVYQDNPGVEAKWDIEWEVVKP